MKVEIDEDITLFVEFKVVPNKKKKNHTTICNIFENSVLTDKSQVARIHERIPASIGMAHCNPKDKYNKAVGKAKALDRAIKGLYGQPTQRDMRLTIWGRFYDLIQTNDVAYLKGRHKYAPKPRRIIQKFPKNSASNP